jgi:predicted nucleic acid-binding protein
MLVVADSSPLIVLINIDCVDVLAALFGRVMVPPAIAAELSRSSRPRAVRDFIAAPPAWLIERTPASVELIPARHGGECAAISFAREINADLLLFDEVRGRRAAAQRGLRFTGTVGVLELAADQGLVDLQEAFDRIKHTDFWIPHDLLDERLKLHLLRRKS